MVTCPGYSQHLYSRPALPPSCGVAVVADSGFRQLEPRQGDVGLFGWSTVPLNASELVLTTNELDAMAVWQSTGRPAVALPMGTSLLPVTLLPMLERFTRLYLWFSDDVPGQEAVERMGRKLGRDRCLVVRSHGGNTDEQSPKVLSVIYITNSWMRVTLSRPWFPSPSV